VKNSKDSGQGKGKGKKESKPGDCGSHEDGK
jgi:hypothetical protein